MKLVKYSATWCGPCQTFAPVVEKVSQELNIPVENIDIDQNPTPGIMSVPTIQLVDKNDNVLAQRSGAMGNSALKSWISSNAPS